MSVTSDLSRSISPAPSARSWSTADSEDRLSDCQKKSLAIIRRICDGDNHPFDKLVKLHSARVVKAVAVEDLSQDGNNAVLVVVDVDNDTQLRTSAQCLQKKQAKKDASQKVLEDVCEYLLAHPPSTLFNVVPCVRKQEGPTASELKIMAEDQQHLRVLERMLKDKEEFITRVVSVDLEQWERDHSIPLEFGITHKLLGQTSYTLHWIVEDNQHRSNGRFCPNNRDNFVFGTSEKVSEAALKQKFDDLLAELDSDCEKIYFVGHTIQSDLKWLSAMNISLPASFVACDIGKAHRALSSPDQFANMMGMERLMNALEIDPSHMHNAGNDSHYNIEVLEKSLQLMSEEGTNEV